MKNRLTVFLVLITIHGWGQQLAVKGLQSPVEVIRDKWGINHIYAQNEHDLFFAQGYCAAKDRLFQFEIWRRQATGTLAEIMGEEELKRDIGARLFSYRGDMDKELAHYHPRGKNIIQSYVDGVNAFIDATRNNPSLLPFEFKLLGIQPGKWSPQVVVSRHQGIRSNVGQELNIARAIGRVGEKKVRELSWFHPLEPDLHMDSTIDVSLLYDDILGPYEAVNRELQFRSDDLATEKLPEGSNNWIISGSRTASGFPILANDPHRRISVPSLRYIVHLSAPGWDVIGGGEPVIPGVSIGHNQYGAWGLTIFETDAEDLYVYTLHPTNPFQYLYNGSWKDMNSVTETFKVKGGKDTTVTLYFTHHGPVTKIDAVRRKAYAIRCAWLEPGGAPYLASLRIDQATNWEEFRDACAYSHIPGENMIWADKKGNIGWQAVGITPIRTTHSGMVPVPGDGRFEWNGFLPIKERPHLLNPSKGFFATANQHVTPSDYPHMRTIAYTWADDYRGNRVNEVLGKMTKSTIEQSMALQTDYYSIPARELVPMIIGFSFSDSLTEESRARLKQWDKRLEPNSIGAGIYIMWEREITQVLRKRFTPSLAASYITVQTSTLIKWLNNPEQIFPLDPIGERNQLLKITFETAVQRMKVRFGNDMNQWKYGQINYKHVQIKHPLSALVSDSLRKQIDLGPFPRGGSGLTPNANGNADNQTAGASFRFITDLSDWDKAVMTNTPGQSGDPSTPFYQNLFEEWATNRFFPAYYSKSKIINAAAGKIMLMPAK